MRRLPLALLGAAMLVANAVHAYPAAKTDSFLDRPLPPGIKLDSDWDPPFDGKGPQTKYDGFRVEGIGGVRHALSELSGKKIVPPLPMMAEEEYDSRLRGKSRRMASFWTVDPHAPMRDVFNRLCLSIGVVPHYDPASDTIKLEMDWKRDDPRSGEELVRVLQETSPVPWEKLPLGRVNIVGGHGSALDPWRIAFDALLSRPRNFDTAGQVRIYQDQHAEEPMGGFPVINLFSCRMRDKSGRPELLVLNTTSPLSNKSAPSDVAYYLFDEDGRFIRAGVYAMGEGMEGRVGKASADSDNAVTIDVGWGSFSINADHAHFALTNNDLVLTGATGSDGQVMTAAEASTQPQDERYHASYTLPTTYPSFALDPNAPPTVKPPAPAPTPPKPVHEHGAMGVRKFGIGGG